MTPEEQAAQVARALLRELDAAMKSPRGDYYQGDVLNPHRTRDIVTRHIAAALRTAREEEREVLEPYVPCTCQSAPHAATCGRRFYPVLFAP